MPHTRLERGLTGLARNGALGVALVIAGCSGGLEAPPVGQASSADAMTSAEPPSVNPSLPPSLPQTSTSATNVVCQPSPTSVLPVASTSGECAAPALAVPPPGSGLEQPEGTSAAPAPSAPQLPVVEPPSSPEPSDPLPEVPLEPEPDDTAVDEDAEPDPSTDASDEPEPTSEEPTESDPEPTTEPEDPEPTTEPAPSEFHIELVFSNDDELDPIVEEAFEGARQRWQEVIRGDLPDLQLQFPFTCDGFELPAEIDDLIIFITTDPIDGREGILGSAGPCLIRGEGLPLPFAGRMIFDSADLLSFAEIGRLEEIVVHEMGHVLGVGSLWGELDLLLDPALDNSGSADTSFEGERAIAEFEAIGGTDYDGRKVPVENTGGEGVANGHWRESVLGNEMMTPFMSQLEGQLSRVTIASLEDIGYEVSYDFADDYSWPPPNEGRNFAQAAGAEVLIDLSQDRLDLPIQRVTLDGVLVVPD
jgi:Leishmanolysin